MQSLLLPLTGRLNRVETRDVNILVDTDGEQNPECAATCLPMPPPIGRFAIAFLCCSRTESYTLSLSYEKVIQRSAKPCCTWSGSVQAAHDWASWHRTVALGKGSVSKLAGNRKSFRMKRRCLQSANMIHSLLPKASFRAGTLYSPKL